MGSFCNSSSGAILSRLILFLVPLSQPHPEPPAILLNELDPGRYEITTHADPLYQHLIVTTGITSDWLPSSRVWCAAAARQTHTICDSPNQKRLAAKSAMSSLCRCVVAIIARFTAVAMKQHGGTRPALIRPFPLVPCGWKAIRCPQRAVTTKAESNGVRLTKRSQLLKSVPHDLHQTDRGQPNYSLT
jgi:hypothetical protein